MTKSKQHPDPGGLVGHFFRGTDPDTGKIQWHGRIIGQPEPGWYLVQLFELYVGETSTWRLVRIEDMTGWLFSADREGVLPPWEHCEARQRRRTRA